VRRRVLIVDDDPSLRTGLAKLVAMHGHEAVTAASVAEAMERLASGPSHVLLDMNLPDGYGTAVLQHVRTKALPVRVAVLSGTADPSLMADAEALRPDAVFHKPPDWDGLIKWLGED